MFGKADPIKSSLLELVHARGWGERKWIVKTNGDRLLDESAQDCISRLIAQSIKDVDVPTVRLLEDISAVLSACRSVGVETAFAPRMPSDELDVLIAEINELVQFRTNAARQEELCRRALALVGEAAHRQTSSMLYDLLGDSLMIQGKREETPDAIPKAIDAYGRALKLLEGVGTDERLADLHCRLGEAHLSNPVGDPVIDLEGAFCHFSEAVRRASCKVSARIWAVSRLGLARVHVLREDGTGVDVRKAVEFCEEALQVFTRVDFPDEWSQTHQVLGDAYWRTMDGDRLSNLKQARDHSLKAQEIRPLLSPRSIPGELVFANGQLYQHGRKVESFMGHHGPFGDHLSELLGELRGAPVRYDEFKRYIAICRNALREAERENRRALWATLQEMLGSFLLQNPLGVRADNLEDAVSAFKAALEVMAPETDPVGWARNMDSLGTCYMERVRGDHGENIEQAIDAFRAAADQERRLGIPDYRTHVMAHLAHALMERRRGDAGENFSDAIQILSRSLRLHNRDGSPREWARIMADLASAYRRRPSGSPSDDIEQAIACYRAALRVLMHGDSAYDDWAPVILDLGNTYLARLSCDRAGNVETAIRCISSAVGTQSAESSPLTWAQLMTSLGVAYAERVVGERSDNLARAVRALTTALEVMKPDLLPRQCRSAAATLGDLYCLTGDWKQAKEAYRVAAQASEDLYLSAFTPASRESETQTNTHVYERMIEACLKCGQQESDAQEAMVSCEAAKARTFLDQLGQVDLSLPDDLPDGLRMRERDLTTRLREKEQEIALLAPKAQIITSDRTTTARLGELAAEREWLTLELRNLWRVASRDYPQAQAYEALRSRGKIDWNALSRLANDLGGRARLVEFFTMEDRTLAFVLSAGYAAPRLFEIPMSKKELFFHYVLPYRDEILDREYFMTTGREYQGSWTSLGERLIRPLLPSLEDAEVVYLVPHGHLHHVPLHALDVDGIPFIARYPIAYTPSAAVLARILAHTPRRQQNGASLVMGFTERQEERSVFLGEAHAVAACLGTKAFVDGEATGNCLVEHGPKAGVVHLSCHGNFDAAEPYHSCVALADGTMTALDWMKLTLNARLVTLSSCRSGVSDVGYGDEITGMSRALLYAGAESALLTLWSVVAETTRDWMLDFYARVSLDRSGTALAVAFQHATLNLRARYEDPYYWAPFVLVGNWK